MFERYLELKNSKKSAFSLIELSIAILIISLIVTGLLSTTKSNIANEKNELTAQRINTLYNAIGNYIILNQRLPCPASIETSNSSASYGKIDSSAVHGTCNIDANDGVFDSGELVYGLAPVKDLDLPSEMAEDGFGSKFSYIVDRRFTKEANITLTDGFYGTSVSGQNIIDIRNASGTTITSEAIIAIISHGPNKYGAYNANSGNVQNTYSGLAQSDEVGNLKNGFDNIFTVNSTTQPAFDDIVSYRTRPQIIAGIASNTSRIKCIAVDLPVNIGQHCDHQNRVITWNNATISYGDLPLGSSNDCNDIADASDHCDPNGPPTFNGITRVGEKIYVACGSDGQPYIVGGNCLSY